MKSNKQKWFYPNDSAIEAHFTWWLDELYSAGILEWERNEESFELSPRQVYEYYNGKKIVAKTIEQPHRYKWDFTIQWNRGKTNFFAVHVLKPDDTWVFSEMFAPYRSKRSKMFRAQGWNLVSRVEIKPPARGKLQDVKAIQFKLNQKWMLKEYGLHIDKIIPEVLFKKTFCPDRYRLTDCSGKPRKINWEPRSLTTFINQYTGMGQNMPKNPK